MPVNAENATDAPAVCDAEKEEGIVNGFAPDLIKERIKANSDLQIEQISALTQLLNQLMHENSAADTAKKFAR